MNTENGGYGNVNTLRNLEFRYHENIDTMPTEMLVSEVRKAGFDVRLEFDRRLRLRNQFGIDRGDYIWLNGVTDQVLEHSKEYSAKDTVRVPPHYLLVDNKLYSPRFDAFAESFTSPIERHGSVVKGLKKVEEKLSVAEDGEFVVWVSPDGKIGIGETEYDYSWTHVFWKEKGETAPVVRYVSLRNDFTLKEHTDLLNILEGNNVFNTENIDNTSYETIKEIVEHPVLVAKDNNVRNLGDIVSIMKFYVRNFTNIAYTDKEDGKRVPFEAMIVELLDISTKQNLERQIVAPIISDFERKLARAGSYDQALRIMANYVLALNSFWRDFNYGGRVAGSIGHIITKTLNGGYSTNLLSTLQQVKGCAATMQNTVNFTSRIDREPFKCPNCPFVTFDPVGNKCPNCGLTKEKDAEMRRSRGEPVCD